MLVGRVYRICVLNIPLRTGQEVFPTIEIVDRLYPPIGQELRFPIQIDLPRKTSNWPSPGNSSLA